jgi:hypothetical protein
LFFLSSSIPIDKFGKDSAGHNKSAFLELTEISRLAEQNLLTNKLEAKTQLKNGALIQTNSKSTSTTMKKVFKIIKCDRKDIQKITGLVLMDLSKMVKHTMIAQMLDPLMGK